MASLQSFPSSAGGGGAQPIWLDKIKNLCPEVRPRPVGPQPASPAQSRLRGVPQSGITGC